MNNFGKEITLTAGWQNLMAIMQANGYAGTPVLGEVNFVERAGNLIRIKTGHTSAAAAPVSNTDGFPVNNLPIRIEQLDAGTCWIYSPDICPLIIIATSAV